MAIRDWLTAALLAALLLHGAVATAHAAGPNAGTTGGGRSPRERQLALSREAYVNTVTEQLQRHLEYPDEARRGRLAGRAVVTLVLKADGGVVHARIARSTGHAVLDREVISSVLRAAPFPALPPGFDPPVTLQAPVRFEISTLRPPTPAAASRCRQGPGTRGAPRSCR